MKEVVYVGSPSRGSRSSLRSFLRILSNQTGMFFFSPCLGFHGNETPEIRKALMAWCLRSIPQYKAFMLYLDAATEGGWQELEVAQQNRIPALLVLAENFVQVPASAHGTPFCCAEDISIIRRWVKAL